MTSRRRSSSGRSAAVRARATAPDVVALIVALGAVGTTQKTIAREAGVSQAHVSRVLSQHRGPSGC